MELYDDETPYITWIGTERPTKFLRQIRERYATSFRCHVGTSELKAAWVVFRSNPEPDISVRIVANRVGIESMDGNDLLVYGNCSDLPYRGISFQNYFATLELDQSIDRFFTWGKPFNSALVSRIIDSVCHRLIRKSVYWEPIDETYVRAGLVPSCQYMEWEEHCHETKIRASGITRKMFAEDCDGNVGLYAMMDDVDAYMWGRKLVADSYGDLMLVLNDECELVLAKRNLFRAEWHPNNMFGDFDFTINPYFTKGLDL